MDLQQFKAACARIAAGGEIGTGYLIAPDMVATCHHVVDRIPDGQAVAVTFHGEREARSGTVCSSDPVRDCALVRIAPAFTAVAPLPVAVGCAKGDLWESFGYPVVAGSDGDVFTGTVRDPQGLKSGRVMIDLFCEDAAAGMATKVSGLSGAPVLVGDRVIGHVSDVRADALKPGQTAWGRIYAVPASDVMKLVGFPGGSAARAVVSGSVAPHTLPLSMPGELDVFVSYRSTDSAFALELVNRLEGSGLRAFFAPTELEPGALLANRIPSAIERSRAGVMLVSREWLASPWCLEEAKALLARSAHGDFPVIPLLLDDVALPPLLAGRKYLDFKMRRAAGPDLAQLIGALRAHAAPTSAPASPASPKPRTDAEARFQVYQEASSSAVDAALLGAQALLDIGEPAAALECLHDAGDGTRATQLRALALARCGKKKDAVALLEPLYDAGQVDCETGGILGGRYKQLWLEQRAANLLDRSFRVYLETWSATGDVYPGVNALAMALWLRSEAPHLFSAEDAAVVAREREEIARRCRDITEKDPDPWRLGTRAEMHLLEAEQGRPAADAAKRLDALTAAKRYYALAAAKFGDRYQNIAVMRRQARRNLQYMGMLESEVDALLPVPSVVAFTGHMTDEAGRTDARFPDSKVKAVRDAVVAYVRKHRVGFGFASAARGSDLIFVEAVLDCGGRVHVFLPFPASEFKITSVGGGWNPTFDDLLKHKRVTVEELLSELPPEGDRPDAYAACNRAILKAARQQAELMDQHPRLLAVWSGRPGGGAGGTSDAVTEWKARVGEPDLIDILTLSQRPGGWEELT